MATPASPIKAVLAALAANLFVAIIKLIAFLLSGSGAMLSEAIHSAADTGNQLLLFFGLRRSAREADDRFHYGYAGERFVFGMLSAAGIFFVGCGVTVYHGVTALQHPHMPELSAVTFVVLGAPRS
ncbi:MAG: cation transporter [Myxococcales bacterium]|nr:cation transporter [Myxococcales bacterium]